MKVLSIIVPIYNVEKYLKECIESILDQVVNNVEIILLNDGSTDESLNIAKFYEERYSNILVVNKENEGLAPTRNLGMNIATGKYIMFLDSDDLLCENSLNNLIEFIENEKSNICIFNGISFIDDNSEKKDEIYFKINKDYNYLNEDKKIKKIISLHSACFKIYSNDFLKSNNIKFSNKNIYGEDVQFWMKCLDRCDINSIKYYDIAIYKRRYREGSIMTSYSEKNFLDRVKFIDDIYYDVNKEFIRYYLIEYIFNTWIDAININKKLGKKYYLAFIETNLFKDVKRSNYKNRIAIYRFSNKYITKIYNYFLRRKKVG